MAEYHKLFALLHNHHRVCRISRRERVIIVRRPNTNSVGWNVAKSTSSEFEPYIIGPCRVEGRLNLKDLYAWVKDVDLVSVKAMSFSDRERIAFSIASSVVF